MKKKIIYTVIMIIASLLMCVFLTGCVISSDEPVPSESDYDDYITVLELHDDSIKVAPSDYDGDCAAAFADSIKTYKVSEDVKVSKCSVETKIDSDGEKTSDVTNSNSSIKEINEDMDNGYGVCAYLKFKDKKVVEIVSYGEITVWE